MLLLWIAKLMASVDQKMKEFQSKSYEERLKISMNIITNLKDRGNAQAQEIYDSIVQMEKVPDEVVNAIYKDFCDSVDRLAQEKIQWQLHHFDEVKTYMQKLRDQEKTQREAEDTESLLDWIEDV